ncbi:MAG: hypothetical protein U0792_10915 [Gemmataceae bacterium]
MPGRRLSIGLQNRNDAPFDDGYDDYLAYLVILEHRRRRDSAGTRPTWKRGWHASRRKPSSTRRRFPAAQVYINLLLAEPPQPGLARREDVPSRGRRAEPDLPRRERPGEEDRRLRGDRRGREGPQRPRWDFWPVCSLVGSDRF